MDGIRHRKTCHAYNEKRKTTNDGRNGNTKSRKNQNHRRRWNLQILGNIGSGYHQTIKKEYIRRSRKLLETKLHINIYPTPPLGQDMTQGQFKRSLTGLNSEFSFSLTSCLTKAKEPNLSYYLPIAGGRIIGFIPFPRVLVLCEMQSVSFRIWTRIVVSNSYDDNHYTTGTKLSPS